MSRTPPATPRPAPKRRRTRPGWRPAFLAALEVAGSVSAALKASGVGRATAYDARAADPEFAAAWADALEGAADELYAEARRRALSQVRKPVLYAGKPVAVWFDAEGTVLPSCPDAPEVREARGERYGVLYEHRYSDKLLILLLKAAKPEKFGGDVRAEFVPPGPPKPDALYRYHELCATLPPDQPAFDIEAKMAELTAPAGVES